MSIHVAVLVFDEVEVLDFAGPYEVFTCAARMHGRQHPGEPALFAVSTIAATKEPVRARAGLRTLPDYAFGEHPPIDCLIVPGGVVDAEMEKPEVISWIRRVASGARITASVCTGAFLLAKAGRVGADRVTTHWEDIPDLRKSFPALEVQEQVRWVDIGSVVTSAGISAGIDMSLHLVERLHSRALALRTARQLDFDWTENRPPVPGRP